MHCFVTFAPLNFVKSVPYMPQHPGMFSFIIYVCTHLHNHHFSDHFLNACRLRYCLLDPECWLAQNFRCVSWCKQGHVTHYTSLFFHSLTQKGRDISPFMLAFLHHQLCSSLHFTYLYLFLCVHLSNKWVYVHLIKKWIATVQRKAEFQEHYAEGAVYVLSMAWFKEWENFVCCKTDGMLNYMWCFVMLYVMHLWFDYGIFWFIDLLFCR